MRGGLPRAHAVKFVHERHDVNLLTCVCAIDRATLPPLMEYWVPGVQVSGVHELVGNALVISGGISGGRGADVSVAEHI